MNNHNQRMSFKMKNLVTKQNAWVIFAMFLFFITKVTALVCATIISIKGNIWIGAALFVGAIVFRITWTFVPNVEDKKVRDEMDAAKKTPLDE